MKNKSLKSAAVGRGRELLVIPHLKAYRASTGNLVLTEKFLSGMSAYADFWPGKVTAMVEVSEQPDSNLDHVEVKSGCYKFQLEETSSDQGKMIHRMRQADLVLGGVLGVNGVRQVVVRETSLRTRLQIIAAQSPGYLRRYKRSIFAAISDWKERQVARRLAGIQCNGTPTYNIYSQLNQNVLLFFDSRVIEDDLVSKTLLEQRTEKMLDGAPLHLAFTGRLMKIKGVDHLPKIAAELRRLGIRFEMNICGGGECEQQLAHSIQKYNLLGSVHLRGVLKYREELLPLVRKDTDLFVCTHVQGDPSCTYLETMACGVPIIGYANEAWAGMAPLSQAGWVTTLNKPELLADKIAELDRHRPALLKAAKTARAFANQHLFKQTMERRVEHMLSCFKKPK